MKRLPKKIPTTKESAAPTHQMLLPTSSPFDISSLGLGEYKSIDTAPLTTIKSETKAVFSYIDWDELATLNEAPNKLKNGVYFYAMINLVLAYFQEGYITPYLFLQANLTYLQTKYQKLNFYDSENYLMLEINNQIMHEMDLFNHGYDSVLLTKLNSVKYKFDLPDIEPFYLETMIAELESISLTIQPEVSISDDIAKPRNEMAQIKKLLANKEFDEAVAKAKQFKDIHKNSPELFYNSIVLFCQAYTCFALELFNKKGHLTFVFYALNELLEYTSSPIYAPIHPSLIKLGKNLHRDLMEIIKKNGLDFFKKIEKKIYSPFAKKCLHPEFYNVLNRVFKLTPDKPVLSHSRFATLGNKKSHPSKKEETSSSASPFCLLI